MPSGTNRSNAGRRTAPSPTPSRKKKRKKQSNLLIYNIVTVILVVGICFCGYTIAIKKIDDSEAAKTYDEINTGRTFVAADPEATVAPDQTLSTWEDFPSDYIPPLDAEDYEEGIPGVIIPPTESDKEYGYVNMVDTVRELNTQYKDVVAFVYVPGLKISYPVCQTDGNYYESHDYQGIPRKAGAIFMSNKSSIKPMGRNIVLHGHNMKDETMFGNLKNYVGSNPDFIKLNRRIYIDTLYGSYRYEIFSVYVVDKNAEEYRTVGFASDDAFLNFCDKIQSMGKYTNPTTFTANDRILTLSTCNDAGEDMRTIVHAKLVWPNPNQTITTPTPSTTDEITSTPTVTPTHTPSQNNFPDRVRVSLDNPNSKLNIRKGPGTDYKIAMSVVNGTVLKVLGEEGDWYKVLYSEKDTFEDGGGYVLKSLVVPEEG